MNETLTIARNQAAATRKTCTCGRHFERVPTDAKFFVDPDYGGYYWNCECKSTLFVPCLEGDTECP